MKKITKLLIVVLLLISGPAFAGGSESENTSGSEWSIGVNLAALDFYSPKLNQFSSFKERMALGPDITVQRNFFKTGLGISMNFLAPSGLSSKANPDLPAINKYMLMIGPGLVYNFQNAYMLKSSFPVAPYLFASALGSWARVPEGGTADKFGLGIPVGAGVNFKIADGVALNIKGGYMIGVTEYFDNNIYWSAGVNLGIGGGKAPEPVVFEPIAEEPMAVDTDGDGIPDDSDECPEIAGLAAFNGCPDTDGDGIADINDECPDVPGLAAFKGCPEPDRDGDGIADSKDRCPDQAGSAALQGCPDRDGDGVADIDDRCPEQAGPVSNQGCPQVTEKAQEVIQAATPTVNFDSERSDLNDEAKKTLDGVVEMLNKNQGATVSVEGHADNTGGLELNERLSEERAKACADYLVSKGINASRISSKGFGPSKPVADNATPEGRAKNRRAELIISIK